MRNSFEIFSGLYVPGSTFISYHQSGQGIFSCLQSGQNRDDMFHALEEHLRNKV